MRLEALESQTELIALITDACEGITRARKQMNALGNAPVATDVHMILMTAASHGI